MSFELTIIGPSSQLISLNLFMHRLPHFPSYQLLEVRRRSLRISQNIRPLGPQRLHGPQTLPTP